jgi:fluoride ion exporter CrcB/FEX
MTLRIDMNVEDIKKSKRWQDVIVGALGALAFGILVWFYTGIPRRFGQKTIEGMNVVHSDGVIVLNIYGRIIFTVIGIIFGAVIGAMIRWSIHKLRNGKKEYSLVALLGAIAAGVLVWYYSSIMRFHSDYTETEPDGLRISEIEIHIDGALSIYGCILITLVGAVIGAFLAILIKQLVNKAIDYRKNYMRK